MKLFLIIFNLITLKVILGRNVARGKAVKYCERDVTTEILTDGITDIEQSHSFLEACPDSAYVDVLLVEHYNVHYIMVYEGKNARGQLDYFMVYMFANGNLLLCSQHFTTSETYLDSGIRVNCQLRPPTNKVRIKSRKNEGLEMREIEVHTLFENQLGAIFIGCFSDFEAVSSGPKSFRDCKNECAPRTSIMGIKNSNNCFCGNIAKWEQLISSTECISPCTISNYSCGGRSAFSLYRVNVVLPYYVGCVRILVESRWIIVDEMPDCISSCNIWNFAYLLGGKRCACTNEVVWEQSEEDHDKCGMTCPDDWKLPCDYQYVVVHGTCKSPDGRTSFCSRQFNCRQGYQDYGVCKNYLCPGNFESMHCLERDFDECEINLCDADDGAYNCTNTLGSYRCNCLPGYIFNTMERMCRDIDECEVTVCGEKECINSVGSYSCGCVRGYNMDPINNVCIDIDECMVDPCDTMISQCTNTIGSFNCNCFVGFILNSTHKSCQDVDECEFEEACDNITSTCTNLDGSYDCECRPFYIKMDGNICISNTTVFFHWKLLIVYSWIIIPIAIVGIILIMFSKTTMKAPGASLKSPTAG